MTYADDMVLFGRYKDNYLPIKNNFNVFFTNNLKFNLWESVLFFEVILFESFIATEIMNILFPIICIKLMSNYVWILKEFSLWCHWTIIPQAIISIYGLFY